MNVLVFYFANLSMSGDQLQHFFLRYGIVPLRYADPTIATRISLPAQLLPFFTSMFLHGGFMHILGNMWVLWIFGDNVEEWFGHWGFLAVYLFCGVASGLMHLLANWGSDLPTVGASGAIAGVMGAYFLLYPRARVLTLVPIFIFIQFVELPAFVFLGFWFLLQFLSGAAGGPAGGIAWWAHVGGFITGAAVVFVLGGGKPVRPSRTQPTLRAPWGGRGPW